MVEKIASNLISAGIQFIFNKWNEREKEIKRFIDDYLNAATKDGYIKNIDAVFMKPRILELLEVTKKLSKKERAINKLEELSSRYIQLVEEICQKIQYDHLTKILSLNTTLDYGDFGIIEITDENFDIANAYLLLFERYTEEYKDIDSSYEENTLEFIEVLEDKLELISKAIEFIEKAKNIDQAIKDFYHSLLLFNTGQLYYAQSTQRIYFLEYEDLLKEIDNVVGYLLRAQHYFEVAEERLVGIYLSECKAMNYWSQYELFNTFYNFFFLKKELILEKALNDEDITEDHRYNLKRFTQKKDVWVKKVQKITEEIKNSFDDYLKMRVRMPRKVSEEIKSKLEELKKTKFKFDFNWTEKMIDEYEIE